MTAALAITGGAILFFFFSWMGGKEDMNDEYRTYAKKFGVGMAISFTIIQAVFFLWYIATLPVMAKSYAVYYSAIICVFLMLIIAILCIPFRKTANFNMVTSLLFSSWFSSWGYQ